jgi:hypothetical protein
MKKLSTLLAALVLVAGSALAADPAPVVKPALKPDLVKPTTPTTPAKADARSAAGLVKVASTGSQQNRMRECNKSATGKKGDERRAFMKSCLSTRKG